MPAPITIADVFTQLDRWRHLPSYQLERRADIYIALFLDTFVAAAEQTPIHPVVIPEFPIKRDLIWPEKPTNKSVKVDCVLFSQDKTKVYFIELKTDADSRRKAQDDYLARSTEIGFRAILEGLLIVAKHSLAVRKYYHLLTHLSQAGVLTLPPDIEARAFERQPTVPHDIFDTVAIDSATAASSIVVRYLEPRATSSQSYSFSQLADHLRGLPGDLAQTLANHLEKWTTPAAAQPPAK